MFRAISTLSNRVSSFIPLHEMTEHETFEVEVSVLTKTANLKVWNNPRATFIHH